MILPQVDDIRKLKPNQNFRNDMRKLVALALTFTAFDIGAQAQDTTLTGQISFNNLVWSDGSSSYTPPRSAPALAPW